MGRDEGSKCEGGTSLIHTKGGGEFKPLLNGGHKRFLRSFIAGH